LLHGAVAEAYPQTAENLETEADLPFSTMAAPPTFASIAERKTEDTPLRVVHIDGHVVLKIVKHSKEGMPTLVTGQLLGLDVGQTLEVTDCFPFPVRAALSMSLEMWFSCLGTCPGILCCPRSHLHRRTLSMLQARNDEEDGLEGDGASYQLDMMRCLREVNVDNNTVGW
jgi:translation initiation factor 3 subunit H